MPLAITVTVATAGLAAWVWSQRKDEEDDDHEPGLDYDNADYGDNPAYGASGDDRAPQQQIPPSDVGSYGVAPAPGMAAGPGMAPEPGDVPGAGWGSRMSGALRRTPSPQQFLDSTGKTVAAGVAAAGAVVGKALASIREEDKPENNPWSEEAEKKERSPVSSGKRRKTVAIVVSADTQLADMDDDGYHEHAVSAVLDVVLPRLTQSRRFCHTSPSTLISPRSSCLS